MRRCALGTKQSLIINEQIPFRRLLVSDQTKSSVIFTDIVHGIRHERARLRWHVQFFGGVGGRVAALEEHLLGGEEEGARGEDSFLDRPGACGPFGLFDGAGEGPGAVREGERLYIVDDGKLGELLRSARGSGDAGLGAVAACGGEREGRGATTTMHRQPQPPVELPRMASSDALNIASFEREAFLHRKTASPLHLGR